MPDGLYVLARPVPCRHDACLGHGAVQVALDWDGDRRDEVAVAAGSTVRVLALELEPAGGPRVRELMTGVPIVHGAERVLDIIEDHGGLVVCMENCTGLKPILDDVDEAADDVMQALAEKYFRLPCSVKTGNDARVESIRNLTRDYRPDCIVELIWQACLTYDIESRRIKRLAEKELGIPYLRIETDYSPSESARIEVRVEALFETVRGVPPSKPDPR